MILPDPRPIPPLILTVLWAPEAQDELDQMRRRFFPPERNIVPAHLTLFHKLPGLQCASILEEVRAACAALGPMSIVLPRVRFLGRGVAIEAVAADLIALRSRLARRWVADLTPQDAQGFRPHVTISNKMEPAAARRLHEELCASWAARSYRAEGLQLWWYEGGPWRSAAKIRFEDAP